MDCVRLLMNQGDATVNSLDQVTNPTSLPLDEAVAAIAVFVIVSGSDGRADERFFEPAK